MELWCVGEWDGKLKPIKFDPDDTKCFVCWNVVSHEDFATKEDAENWISKAKKFDDNRYYTPEELYELNKLKDKQLKNLKNRFEKLSEMLFKGIEFEPVCLKSTKAKIL